MALIHCIITHSILLSRKLLRKLFCLSSSLQLGPGCWDASNSTSEPSLLLSLYGSIQMLKERPYRVISTIERCTNLDTRPGVRPSWQNSVYFTFNARTKFSSYKMAVSGPCGPFGFVLAASPVRPLLVVLTQLYGKGKCYHFKLSVGSNGMFYSCYFSVRLHDSIPEESFHYLVFDL